MEPEDFSGDGFDAIWDGMESHSPGYDEQMSELNRLALPADEHQQVAGRLEEIETLHQAINIYESDLVNGNTFVDTHILAPDEWEEVRKIVSDEAIKNLGSNPRNDEMIALLKTKLTTKAAEHEKWREEHGSEA